MPPTFLIDSLNGVRRKVKVLSVAFGVGVVLAWAVALVMGTVALDFLFNYVLGVNLPGGMRALLLVAIVAAFGYCAFRWVVRPVLARLSLSEVAGHLESVFPEFDDRLRSTVNFVEERTDVPGSDFMKERVVTQATELVQKTDLSRALVTRPVWYSLGTAIALVGLLVGVSMVSDSFRSIGLPRLLAPFTNKTWPKMVEIKEQSLPGRVPVGQRVQVSMTLAKGLKDSTKATIYYQYDDGPVQKEYMIRDGQQFNASLDAHGHQLKVWMAAGDAETVKHVVAVVPRLAIQGVTAVVTPPAYAQMPPTAIDISKVSAYAVTGSSVAVRVQFNKPLDANLAVEMPVIRAEKDKDLKTMPYGVKLGSQLVDRTDAAAPVFTFDALESFRFHVKATDTDGFENAAIEEYEVIVKPDQLPTVVIESPKKTRDCTPYAEVPVQVLAEDDFGIATLRLIVDRIGVAPDAKDPNAPVPAGALKRWEVPLTGWVKVEGTGERQRFRLNWDWRLKEALNGEAKPGDTLEYFIEVQDNYHVAGATPPRHPAQFSSKLRINVMSEEQISEAKRDEVRHLAEVVDSILSSQKSTRVETKTLAEETKDKPELSKGDKAQLEGMQSRESAIVSKTTSAAQQLEDIAKDLKENKINDKELNEITKGAKQDLQQAAEKPMTDAAKELNKAAQSKSNPANPEQQQKAKEGRNESLKQSEQSQAQAEQKLDAAMKKMKEVGNLTDMIKQLEVMRDKQKDLQKELKDVAKETLGKDAKDLTDQQKKDLDKIANEQRQLAEKMDAAVAKMDKMKDQMKKSDPETSQAMEEASSKAKSQQIAPKQKQAADEAQKNQQAQAQNKQQEAELGIETVLNALKEAENRKLAQLKKMLDKAEEAIADLVRRQAGINIDTLDLQGGDAKTKALNEKELDVLYAKAKRKQGPGQKVDLAAVTSGQETLERNTRTVADDVEKKVKGVGAEVAQHLVRAAGKMGYAIVDLRDKKLASAYNPQEIDALASLEKAMALVEDAKKKVQDEENQKQAEVLKARLEKVRASQDADVNKVTAAVEAKRRPDGTLIRADELDLKGLVKKEGDLSTEMVKIAEDLRGLGGIVYVDAGKEVAAGMDEVKEDLNHAKSGQTTQLSQQRIIEQLDAMIESLKKDMDQSKFNQKQDGGGGGGGQPPKSKFPTEAELKLLKALQLAVNKNTKAAGELPKDKQDKVALVNLGNRQGKLRSLLDSLLKENTRGKEGLQPEPKDVDQLPEEAGKEAIENKEADDELLRGDPQAKKETAQLNRVGDRMARSRQRLANNGDPGKTTQEIQRRIVIDIDDMIKQSQQQQANNSPKPGEGQPKPGEGDPKPGQGQQQADGQGKESKPNNAQNAAQESTVSQGGSRDAQLNKAITESGKEWGAISPRLREAVMEGAHDNVPEKYKKLIEDYYRGISAGGKQP